MLLGRALRRREINIGIREVERTAERLIERSRWWCVYVCCVYRRWEVVGERSKFGEWRARFLWKARQWYSAFLLLALRTEVSNHRVVFLSARERLVSKERERGWYRWMAVIVAEWRNKWCEIVGRMENDICMLEGEWEKYVYLKLFFGNWTFYHLFSMSFYRKVNI